MQAHIPTLFLVIITVSFILAAVLAAAGYRKKPELMLWASSLVLHGLAFMLFSLRGEISDFLSIVIANIFISAIFVMIAEGFFFFLKRRPPRFLIWSPLVVTAIAFTYWIDHITPRVIFSGFVYGAQCILLVYFVIRYQYQVAGRGKYIFAASAFIEAVVLFSRGILVANGHLIPGLATSNSLNTITFLTSIICLILLVIGLFLMTWERDQQTLVQREAELKVAIETTEQERRQLEVTFKTANDGIYIIDENGLLVDANDAFLDMHGFDKSMIGHLHVQDWDAQQHSEALHSYMQKIFKSKHKLIFETVHRHHDGKNLYIEVSANTLTLNNKHYIYCAARDITDRKKLQAQLTTQAHSDYLTGLNNRRYFVELSEKELERVRRYNKPLSLLMLDIDNFKHVNDTYGHSIGDVVLKRLAEICMNTVREIDIAGRLGGEEFGIVLPETKIDDAMEVAERLRKAIEVEKIKIDQQAAFNFTISIGVASLTGSHNSLDDLMISADNALYAAKASGKNKVVKS
jgi:diguanylate cyclase (GGDEF)-like protein/PAS domain S-box-containing protein